MDPQAYRRLIKRMADRSGPVLESFFDSHGLGDAYREGYGKKDGINRGLTAAREEGTYDAVLADALRQYGEATSTGEAPWPPALIRFELERLIGLCQVEGRPSAQVGVGSSASHAPPRRS